MLQKPGKPQYDIPKAYWPIALLNMLAKLLSSIMAEGLSCLTKVHQLIPPTHFSGRPGRTTTDSLHLLVDTIKAAWSTVKLSQCFSWTLKELSPMQ